MAVGASVGVSDGGARVSVARTMAAGSSVGAVVSVGIGLVAVAVGGVEPNPTSMALPRTIPIERQAITTRPAPSAHKSVRLPPGFLCVAPVVEAAEVGIG